MKFRILRLSSALRVKRAQLELTMFLLLLAMALGACSPPPTLQQATEIPILTLTSTATATSASVPQQTNTPNIPPTPEPTSTPQVQLNGLIENPYEFPVITAEQEQAKIQQAKKTVSLRGVLPGERGSFYVIDKVSPAGDPVQGEFLKIDGMLNKTIQVRDSYAINIGTADTPQIVHKVLLELYVTFEDGSQGSVIVPTIVSQMDNEDDLNGIRGKIYRLTRRSNNVGYVENMLLIVELSPGSRKPENPIVQTLLDSISDEDANLLHKAFELAKQGKFLSQEEIDMLYNAILWYF